MAVLFGTTISAIVDRLVRWVIVPIAGVVPWLVSSGLLLVGFAALWVAFFAALVADQAALDTAWRTIGGLPLPAQAVAWLLFLPQVAGLWTWSTDWPPLVRLVLIAGIAGWNLLMFIPRREASAAVAAR